jgi:Zn-dependent peptidase ImmA (M78 family)
LKAISKATFFPLHFFYQEGTIVPENLIYRKRQHVAQKWLTPINGQCNVLRRHVQFLTRSLNVPAPTLPCMKVTVTQTPQKIARKVRRLWNINTPVIANLTQIVEEQGIVVLSFPFGTERVDSRSMITEDGYPIIFLNKHLLGDRLRFSLAYELAHLLLHTHSDVAFDRDITGEANAFAAELLMPDEEISREFSNGITVPLLGNLKKKWKVSMISLLYRADDLGYLTPNQKRYLLQQFNQLNIRRREPLDLDVPVETPRLMKRWLAQYRTQTKLGTLETAALMCLNVDEFIELYS